MDKHPKQSSASVGRYQLATKLLSSYDSIASGLLPGCNMVAIALQPLVRLRHVPYETLSDKVSDALGLKVDLVNRSLSVRAKASAANDHMSSKKERDGKTAFSNIIPSSKA
ncbi:hypothetical protein [Sphingomonas glacialis]|uniref:hypothetical protein n=1 Tax=Sphingomonas glacialis TaxID=658225 RepID=UPI00112CB2F7|nr:hypothetical protein [Sphingomonas glacialis]